MRILLVLWAFTSPFVFMASCADTSFEDQDATAGQASDLGVADSWEDLSPGEASVPPPAYDFGKTKVFAHTEGTLFQVDPDTLDISISAGFSWPPNTELAKMTDIALDKKGRMIGVSKTTVYAIDPQSAACTRLAALASTEYHFVGLSFVVDPTAVDRAEVLMGIDKEGAVYDIDPATGATRKRGVLGDGLQASGDIVSVRGYGTVATVNPLDSETDWLAQIDPGTGKATLIGDIGFSRVWGLGYWKGRIYGFTAGGEFILIDLNTGKGALQAENNEAWWGAGVTTEAPVVE